MNDLQRLVDSLLFVKRTNVLIDTDKSWFSLQNERLKTISEFEPIKKLEIINPLRDYAKKLYEQDVANYNSVRESSRKSDNKWIKTVLKTGTLTDKISANSLLIKESAVHNLEPLDNLLSSIKLSKKRECILAIDALKDVFNHNLLPQRALRHFHENAFNVLVEIHKNDPTSLDRQLILWYYESLLKLKYTSFIKTLQTIFQDTVSATKFKVVMTLFDLIRANQHEQEKFIVEMIVNKLGDPDYQVSAKIVYNVKNYLIKCPKMKMDFIKELERLVCRQNIKEKAQFYGFCCLNQIVLTRTENQVANRLLLIYFSFFKKFIKNKEIDSRMLNAILIGVNRAYKFSKMENDEIDKNIDNIFKIVHISPFNVSIQALALLNQVKDSREDIEDRFYSAFYRRIFHLEWRNTSKQTYFLKLLYESMSKDQSINRKKAFVKRILQICFSQNVSFVTASLMIVSELMSEKKEDLMQLDHAILVKNGLLSSSESKFDGQEGDEDDEEEKFFDAKTSDDDEPKQVETKNKKKESKENKKISWIHKNNVVFKRHTNYDFNERNPMYAGAEKTLTYELLALTRHYHPTVALFATKLLNNEKVEYTGNPMEDFTLMHFLDRFVYKKPKDMKKKVKKSVFSMPVASSKKTPIKQLAVNSKEYLGQPTHLIPVEEKIFYDFYKAKESKKVQVEDAESENESISDSEFDAYLSKTEVDGADPNDEDWVLDFANSLSNKKNKGKKKKNKEDSMSEDDSIMDEFEDNEDIDDDEDFENYMNENMKDDKEGASEDSDMDDAFIDKPPTKKRRKDEDLSSLFAAADEYSNLLNESSKFDQTGSGSISNFDNSHPKQLKWEQERNRDFRRPKHRGKTNFKRPNSKKTSKPNNKNKTAKRKRSK